MQQPIGRDGIPESLRPRLAAVEWADNVHISWPPAPPWMSDVSWEKLCSDTHRLLVLLATICDLGSGRVEYQPEIWARELGVTTSWLDECVGFLAGDELAYWDLGGVETYAVQLPDELRCAFV